MSRTRSLWGSWLLDTGDVSFEELEWGGFEGGKAWECEQVVADERDAENFEAEFDDECHPETGSCHGSFLISWAEKWPARG